MRGKGALRGKKEVSVSPSFKGEGADGGGEG